MVAKISTGQSLYGALAYNQEKVDEGHAKILAANLVLQPEDGQFSIGDCMKDFQRWMPSHYRTEKPVIHISLNPHPDDVLTDEQLTAIGEEYMQKLGYGNQPYLILSMRTSTAGISISFPFGWTVPEKRLTTVTNTAAVKPSPKSWNKNTVCIRQKGRKRGRLAAYPCRQRQRQFEKTNK